MGEGGNAAWSSHPSQFKVRTVLIDIEYRDRPHLTSANSESRSRNSRFDPPKLSQPATDAVDERVRRDSAPADARLLCLLHAHAERPRSRKNHNTGKIAPLNVLTTRRSLPVYPDNPPSSDLQRPSVCLKGVASRFGAVALGRTCPLPPLSYGDNRQRKPSGRAKNQATPPR